MSKLIMKLRGLFRNLEQVEFELRQYAMVMESGKLTADEVAMLAEGPTMDQLDHAKARLLEEIEYSLNNMGQVLDDGNKAIKVGSEEGEASS